VASRDTFDPATVFSSIDERGRYAYGNQPGIPRWSLARLAEALLPLPGDDSEAAVEAATDALSGFAAAYERHWDGGMAARLGITAPDPALARDALELMRSQAVDFTCFFRALPAGTARALFTGPGPFDARAARREALLPADRAAVAAAVDRVNPVYIPRSHRVEEALAAAAEGDTGPFGRLADAVSRPFEERPGREDYAGPAPVSSTPYRTYCGT
jgi:serine/tyrosine/threonine adenylyltransferase